MIETPQNIPNPDPSTLTVRDIKESIAALSSLVDAKLGGIQAVIAEQFKSIERRLSDRDAAANLVGAAAKESVATALAAVVETGKGGNIRFDLLERRVAALELALSQSLGKSSGTSYAGDIVAKVIGALAAIIATIALFLTWKQSGN
jgi:hypothetical protein